MSSLTGLLKALKEAVKPAVKQTPKLLRDEMWNVKSGVNAGQSIFRNAPSVLDKSVLPAALTGAGIAGAVLGSPDESEALMIPEVRAEMLKLIRSGGKQIFHHARGAENMMQEGIKDPMVVAKQLESHKPFGLFATDKPTKIPGHLSGSYKGTETSVELKKLLARDMLTNAMDDRGIADNTIRMVIHPEARIKAMYEKDMAGYNREAREIYRDLWAREHPTTSGEYKGANTESNPFEIVFPNEAKAQHYQDIADILHIKDVDQQPGLSEYMILNPDKVSMFYENMMNRPGKGFEIAGPQRDSSVFKKVEKEDRWDDVVDKYDTSGLFSKPSVAQLDNIQHMFESTDIPDSAYEAAEKALAKPKPDFATTMKEKEQVQQMMKSSSVTKDIPLDQKIDLYQSLVNSAVDKGDDQLYNSFSRELEKLQRQLNGSKSSSIASELPDHLKFALASALGLGALSAPDKTEALPLGELKPLTKPIANATRSKDAFSKLIGHTLPNGMEIVDVQKNLKNDWRYLIVKDADGKRSQLPMTKDYLNAYLGAVGTKKYLNKFGNAGDFEKQLQTQTSLDIRSAKRTATSDVSKTDFRQWNAAQAAKVKQIDPNLVHDYAYVKDLSGQSEQPLYMPRAYADYLAKQGLVKILKR